MLKDKFLVKLTIDIKFVYKGFKNDLWFSLCWYDF